MTNKMWGHSGKNPDGHWRDLLAQSLTTAEDLAARLPVDTREIGEVIRRYPMRINPYYLSLIERVGDPIWKQAVPDIREIADTAYGADPLAERALSPVPSIIHRYPDRAVFMVSNDCAVYCRFCLRKRRVGRRAFTDDASIADGLAYLRQNRHLHEVILSGGDPLLLDDDRIEFILSGLRAISHIEVIRIHTRVPCVLPGRIDHRLAALISRYHPLFLNTHFNHPREITPAATTACRELADAGIPLGCQTVLLKGVNDNPIIMRQLMKKLVNIRIKPYYLHHADPVKGTGHFRTTVATGLGIMKALRGNISGLCIPQYMLDLPGGSGKVPLLPDYCKDGNPDELIVENYQGRVSRYPLR